MILAVFDYINKENKMSAQYVKTNRGDYLVQVEDNKSTHGFYLCDDEQSWDGGFGIAEEWEIVDESDVPGEVKEELAWIIEDNA